MLKIKCDWRRIRVLMSKYNSQWLGFIVRGERECFSKHLVNMIKLLGEIDMRGNAEMLYWGVLVMIILYFAPMKIMGGLFIRSVVKR